TGKIRTELQKHHDELTATVERLGRMEDDFRAEYLKLSQDVKKFSKYSADLDRRRGELRFIQDTTNKLGLELEKLQFELSIGGERIELIEKARRPRSRNTKGRDKMTLMAACAGIALALAGTALFEFYHRRVTSGEEMTVGLGLRVLGNVPMLSERLWRFRRNGSGNSGEDLQGIMDESVDGIRAMLLHSSDGDVGRVLMVTSAKAGEGKTTVAGALAASLGRSGRRTLLIDGDLRRPSVHRLLDLSLDAGLAEVLRGEASVDDVIRPTRAAGLWCMSAGQCDHVALQALTKECVGEIFETVRSEFDFVIIDTGPVMSVVDALLLGQHCDGAVLSVVRRVSQLTTVHETCERLKATGIRIVGCVINGLQGNPFTPGYYAYAYGYGYGNGYGNGESTTEDVEKA
ncbi:MAG: CpsD/CapB family tyrosine-protein kinase, partial [Planctomycetota bacterium]|nr:CpsD/CapB family tyrosine-protein kinase [Planctomycetota bacterium]